MTDAPTLSAFRLADTALPVGTDSVSYGLEQFVAAERVEDIADIETLLETYLRRQLGPCDLVVLRAAHEPARQDDLQGVLAADRQLAAVTLAAEFRESQERTGQRLLELQCDVSGDPLLAEYADADDAPRSYPAVLGAVAGREAVPVREACLLACHGFVNALLRAAQRLLRLGATEIQRALDALQSTMIAAVDDSADRSLDSLTPFAPGVGVASMRHERADRRLFLS